MSSSTYMLQIPQVDKAFFDTLVKKMGWTASSVEVPMETLAALDEVRKGKTEHVAVDSLENFIKSLE